MSGFRGSDDDLDREIRTLQGIVRVRLKRTVREFAELDRDLRELLKERTRRRGTTGTESTETVVTEGTGDTASA